MTDLYIMMSDIPVNKITHCTAFHSLHGAQRTSVHRKHVLNEAHLNLNATRKSRQQGTRFACPCMGHLSTTESKKKKKKLLSSKVLMVASNVVGKKMNIIRK